MQRCCIASANVFVQLLYIFYSRLELCCFFSSLYSLQTWYMQGTASQNTFSWLHRQFIAVESTSPLFTDKLLMFNWKNKRKYVESDCRINAFIDGRVGWGERRRREGGGRKVIVMAHRTCSNRYPSCWSGWLPASENSQTRPNFNAR